MTAESIAETLTQDMLRGVIRPGADLLQKDLADRFSVSRIPIRDALRQLAIDGLVSVIPNRGARVIQLSAEEVREVYDLRLLLEADILARAIAQMTEDDLNRIQLALERSNLDARTDDWANSDWMFHRTLYAPANRPRQQALIESLRRTCQVHVAAYNSLPNQTPRWLDDHAALVALCTEGNSDAAVTTLRAHLQGACAALQEAMP